MATESDTKLILDAFQTTWVDFYRWEREDCANTLKALQLEYQTLHNPRLLPQWMRPSPSGDTHVDIAELPSLELFGSDPHADCDEIEITEYTSTPPEQRTEREAISVSLKVPQDVMPCPQYESCIPRQRNTALGDDSSVMPFIPFADDPSFNLLRLYSEYDHFQWQVPMKDPNLEHIVVETLRKLHTECGLTFDRVEEAGVLPLDLDTLLRTCHGRDFLPWSPGLRQWLSQLDRRGNLTPLNVFQPMARSFCISCATGHCPNHFRDTLPNPLPSLVTVEAFERDVDSFCSGACFVSPLETPSTTWTRADEEQLTICIHYSPDMVPCGIAKICGKPCVEVFERRKNLPPSESRKRVRRPFKAQAVSFLDHDDRKFSFHMDSPCAHDGPCAEQNGCPCSKSRAHCTSKCLCEQNCLRRWPGCKCNKSRSKPACMDHNKCQCFSSNRECEPNVCVGHHANAYRCGNIQMQVGQVKRTCVRQSTWGFGLFVEEAVKKNELIDEYVGELIYELTARSRGHVERHRHRNYLFDLNPTLSIDSSFVGNATRYINHSRAEFNCYAKVLLVGGEQRIGIMAGRDLEAGEELLMDYGEEFFINAQSDDTTDEARSAEEDAVRPVESGAQVWPPIDHSSDETYDEENENDGVSDSG